jgi:hypothetical protein
VEDTRAKAGSVRAGEPLRHRLCAGSRPCVRRAGRALGLRGGFYDKLLVDGLSLYVWLVAGAFESQMVEKVPVDEHDVRWMWW